MSRESLKPVAQVPDLPINTEVIEKRQSEAAERLTLVVQQYGNGVPFDPYRYQDIVRTHLSRSAEEMLSAGRALVVAREHLPHGEWTDFLRRCGLEPRLAQRMSQAAIKFSNASTSTHLIEAAGTKSKLFELLVLDDEEIKELSEGGSVAGLELDDIARMPVSELRKALRDAREEAKAADRIRAERSERIDALEQEVQVAKRRIHTQPVADAQAQLLREFNEMLHGAEHAIRADVHAGIAELRLDSQENGNGRDHEGAIAAGIARLQLALDNLRDEFGVAQLAANATPAWAEEQ